MSGEWRRHLVALGAAAALWGCAFLQVAPLEHASRLVPPAAQREGYTVGDDGSVTYHNGDLQVVVEPMSDDQLNQLFPQESALGEYSINPYTFGDWVDPNLGYVPNRFTVFRVTVRNRDFAKVELDPLRAVLTTDRHGEVLGAYGILAGAAPRTFEAYYRARRRPSGNEYYRFSMRMGIVRSNNYGVDKKIFNGESYSGFIVFDPLAGEVGAVRLTLRDFVLKFNAFDMPLERTDLVFDFQHRTHQSRGAAAAAAAHPWSTARLRAASQVSGNATGDVSRETGSIDTRVGEHLPALNECFAAEYAAGRAAEGQLDVRYEVGGDGAVLGAAVVHTTVVSQAVGECVGAQVLGWDFGATTIPVELLVGGDPLVAGPYVVTVVSHLEFLDARAAP
ncbi:MAG: hypothetical protein ABIL09_09090 [Gemmatimonadota bacterium]